MRTTKGGWRRWLLVAGGLAAGLALVALAATGFVPSAPSPPGTSLTPAATAETVAPGSATPATLPLGGGEEAVPGRDLVDALLLYSSQSERSSDYGFRMAVGFYGLRLAELDLAQEELTDAALRDEAGAYIQTIYVETENMEALLAPGEVALLRQVIASHGVNLLVGELRRTEGAATRALSAGVVTGARGLSGTRGEYLITEESPEVTRELGGVAVTVPGETSTRALVVAGSGGGVRTLVGARDGGGSLQPVMVQAPLGKGAVFFSSIAGHPRLRDGSLFDNFYPIKPVNAGFEAGRVLRVLPYLMFVRFSAGEEAWHREQDFANLTVDDPALARAALDYGGLLADAQAHDYHVTIAMPSARASAAEQAVIDLFRNHPDRLSVVQHGNEHDGYEFYRYQVNPGDTNRARPLPEQEADIAEGQARMDAFAERTGIPWGKVMVFPHGLSPEPTLALLKQYGFWATVNSSDVPLDAERAVGDYAHIYPAELAYGAFASLIRHKPNQVSYPFELFLDRPVLTYLHPPDFEAGGIGMFGPYAEAINQAKGKVAWRSLGDIARNLYLERRADDGSVEVMFFGGSLSLANPSDREQRYHLRRSEDTGLKVAAVTVGDVPVTYRHSDGVLSLDLTVPAKERREVAIRYAGEERDLAVAGAEIRQQPGRPIVTAEVINRGRVAGPVVVGVFALHGGERSQVALGLATVPRVEPGQATQVEVALLATGARQVSVVADPFDDLVETNEDNNAASSPAP